MADRSTPPRTSPTAGWVRILVPGLLLVAWLAVGAVGGPYFGKISEVTTNDQATFLPESAESTRVAQKSPQFFDTEAVPAVVVFQRDGGLTEADQIYLAEVSEQIAGYGLTEEEISAAVPADDGQAAQVVVPLTQEDTVADDVGTLRAQLEGDTPDGLAVHVTGPAGFTAELLEGFAGIDGLLLIVTLAVVLVILLFVYRSPVLPFVVLATSVGALCAAILVVYFMADRGWVQVNGQVQGILFILVVGAATDYGLLYVARYRDALRHTAHRWDATRQAVRGTLEPVLASASTVIAGLLCLLLSDLASNRALGPVAATGIVMAVLAAFTFLPAVLSLLGRAAFWPARPLHDPDRGDEVRIEEDAAADPGDKPRTEVHGHGVWGRIATWVTRAPRAIWISSVIVLAIGAGLSPQLKADGVAQSDLVLGEAPAAEGQVVLAEHFPGGSGSPAQMLVPEGEMEAVADRVAGIDGVDSVGVRATDAVTGTVPLGPGAEQLPEELLVGEPTVVEGEVLMEATLSDPPDSTAAFAVVDSIRAEVHAIDPAIAVGGETATSKDTLDTAQRDRQVIVPVILVVITVILAMLLRSLLAPVLLVATTVLSYLTALGVSALIFNHVLDFPGADPAVPLYGFVFLVALGIDYNIFLMSRVREESLLHGTRPGVLRALVVTGSVITSAGVVLAATFGALAVIPIIFLVQLAIMVAFGVLLDALMVRSLLVPALVYDLGKVIWWPSKLWRHDHDPALTPDRTLPGPQPPPRRR